MKKLIKPTGKWRREIVLVLSSEILASDDVCCNIASLLRVLAKTCDLGILDRKDQYHASPNLSGTILMEKQNHPNDWLPHLGWPTMRVVLSHSGPFGYVVKFTNSKFLPRILREKKIYCHDPSPVGEISVSGEILAKVNDKPVWITRVEHGVRHDVLLLSEPWLSNEARLFEHLKGDRLFRLIPLIEWMRSVSGWRDWKKPKMKACFMFDDPNLHWKSYGWIDFKKLSEDTSRHNYCVSIATVPVDMWYFNKSTAQIFRSSSDRLSLLFHGYNHSYRELANGCDVNFAVLKMVETVARVRRLEYKAGLKVSMVMAPPHGGFNLDWMKACAIVGFESASIAWGSIWSSNKEAQFTTLLGADPGRIICGLGILPRFRLKPGEESQVLLSAYLGQPIIPVGHHWNLADGLEILNSLAEFTNSLGDICWHSPGKMARANYWWRLAGRTVVIRPFSRLVQVKLPDRVEEAIVELDEGNQEFDLVAWTKEGYLAVERSSERSWALRGSVGPNLVMELRHARAQKGEGEWDAVNENPRSPITADFEFMFTRALGKRLLVEARDRLMPHLPRSFLKRWMS